MKKNNIKRIMAAVLVFTMAVGISCVSYAKDEEEKDYTISNAAWDDEETEITAVWDEANSKTSYKVQLYKGTKKQGNSVTTSQAEYDFTSRIKAAGYGTYYFTVRPTKGSTDMSIASEKISITSSMISDYEAKENNTPSGKSKADDAKNGPGANKAGTWKWEYDGWHYILENGSDSRSGWINDNGGWYHMNAAGIMEKGIIDDNGETYFLTDNGAMATGWQQINGTWYFFNTGDSTSSGHPNGSLLKNTTTPDGYNVGSDGSWIQ